MKKILSLLMLFLSISSFGQKLTFTFGPDIQITKDSSILAIKELWVSSLTNSGNGFGLQSKDYGGVTYFIRTVLELPEFMGEMNIFDIKQADRDYYQIRNIWSIGSGDNKTVFGKFNVYALRIDSVFRLYNSFEYNQPHIKSFKYKNYKFYYLLDFPFNFQKAIFAVDECERLTQLYGIKQMETNYIIGHNLDEAWRIIGFDYSPLSSPSSFAGRKIKNMPIIISCREDHIHEMIHNIFMASSDNALFQEGIATYYGGTNGIKYPDLLEILKQSIIRKPNIDLTNIWSLDSTLNDKIINNYYVLGAIFIEFALKNGGIPKVLSLVKYQDLAQDDFTDDFDFIEKKLNIPKNKINSFLKNYILNYKENHQCPTKK